MNKKCLPPISNIQVLAKKLEYVLAATACSLGGLRSVLRCFWLLVVFDRVCSPHWYIVASCGYLFGLFLCDRQATGGVESATNSTLWRDKEELRATPCVILDTRLLLVTLPLQRCARCAVAQLILLFLVELGCWAVVIMCISVVTVGCWLSVFCGSCVWLSCWVCSHLSNCVATADCYLEYFFQYTSIFTRSLSEFSR